MASKKLPRRVGAYDIERRLAAGGMGEVLLASHQLLERPVALKRLVPPDEVSPEVLAELEERFLREGRMLAKLHHQSICGVYDLFSYRSAHYIALEYVDGYDLRTLLKHGALPLDVALIVAEKVADALEHAHVHGIVHRDVKPANVMVSRTGEVKLMDFGIARAEDQEGLTRTGVVVGTPTYMAPEVLRGKEAGPAADVYGLGATLYRALAGKPLFKKATPEVIYRRILEGRIRPLRSVNPDVPRRVARVVHKALATAPEKRHETAADLRHELQEALTSLRAAARHEERLVQFLYADGHLSAEDALTVVRPEVLDRSRNTPVTSPRAGWRWAAATLVALVLGIAGLWAIGPASLEDVARQVTTWLAGFEPGG